MEFATIKPPPAPSSQHRRIYAREVSSGNQRGTQNILGQQTLIDEESGDRIVLGHYSDEFGIFGLTFPSGDFNKPVLSWKIVGQTYYFYDLDNGNVNIIQLGQLPDDSYGLAISKLTQNVADAFS